MNWKKYFGRLTFVFLILAVLAVPVFAGIETPPIYVGGGASDYEFMKTDEGVTITGLKKNPQKNVVIPSMIEGKDVVAIGSEVFLGQTSVNRVTLPDTVRFVGERAFYGCTSLSAVTFSEGVEEIGAESFFGCISLETLAIPSSVTRIGKNAFEETLWLASFPQGVIDADGFVLGMKGDCPAFLNLKEGSSVIADGAFEDCEAIVSVDLPASVKAVGQAAFPNSLASVWYAGEVADREGISVAESNEALLSANWHFVDGASDTVCNACGLGRAISDLITVSMNLSVKERLYLNLWLDAEGVEAYKKEFGEDFFCEAFVTIGGERRSLGKGIATEEPVETEYGTFYILQLSALPANHFDKTIEVVSPIFTINTVADEALNLLNLAKSGMNGGHDEKSTNLFRALYNYGASALGGELISLPDDFLKDEGADPIYGIRSHDAIHFTGMQLLMGDAVGIRLLGKASDRAEEMLLTALIDGQKTERSITEKNVDEDGNLILDLYVSAEYYDSEIDVTVSVDGVAVFRLKTDIKGYSEWANDGTDPCTLALAQLVQACVDM